MDKRNFLLAGAAFGALALAGCTTSTGSSGNSAALRQAIDAGVDSALTRLYSEVPGSKDMVARAAGIVVFPSFDSAGLIIGGSYGEGALRKEGRTAAYLRMNEASIGLLAGAQSQAVFILFMSQEALQRFEASSGWTAGVDSSITVASVGANARVTGQTVQQPVVSYVLANSGLMANASVNGSRITRLNI
jgi:lipid-binding SYLF domain-containing protein